MPRIELAPQVADDLQRIHHHLTTYEAHSVKERLQNIMAAITQKLLLLAPPSSS